MQKVNASLAPKRLIRTFNQFKKSEKVPNRPRYLNSREVEFLKLACTEMTYKEIAGKMFLSARTIDGYRDSLFEKLAVKSRVGLVLYAIRNGIVSV